MLIYSGGRHAGNGMVTDFLQLLGLTSTLRSCDGRCCGVSIHVHVPLQACMWPMGGLWSVILLHERQKKATCHLQFACTLWFRAHRISVFPFMGERAVYLL